MSSHTRGSDSIPTQRLPTLPYLDDPVRITRLGRLGKPMGPLPPIFPDATEPPARPAILLAAADGMAALEAFTPATGALEAFVMGALADPRAESEEAEASGTWFAAETRAGARFTAGPPRALLRTPVLAAPIEDTIA